MKSCLNNFFVFLIIALSTTSCESEKTGYGDIVPVIAREAIEYGARLSHTNSLPLLQAHWTIKKDKNGFECALLGVNYDSVEAVLFKIFGNSGETENPTNGPRACLFKASEIGVALIAIDKTNIIQINCIRAMTNLPFLNNDGQ